MKAKVLVVPGLYNSGPEHWQTLWERAEPRTFARVEQANWDAPKCADWVAKLDSDVRAAATPVVLAAHSLACATVAHWAKHAGAAAAAGVKGALLVAPSDVESRVYPPGTEGFAPMPLERLPFPSIVVASSDDPYVALDRARDFADAWGAEFVDAGPIGHVNSSSGLGDWPDGRALLDRLR